MLYKRLVQIVSGWVALCHLFLGVAGLFAGAPLMAQLVKTFYGAELQIDPTLYYVVKLIAVYFIAFGALASAIMVKPQKFLGLVPIIITFFVLRIAELVYFYRFVGDELHVPDGRLTEKIFSFAVIVILLGASAYKLRTSAPPAAPQTH
jgi:hypothetical protein